MSVGPDMYLSAWQNACTLAAEEIVSNGGLTSAALVYSTARTLIVPMTHRTREESSEWWEMLRAVCTAEDAMCIITVAEAWASSETAVRPSESDTRREVVLVSGTWRDAETGLIESRTSYREVSRAADGTVEGLLEEMCRGGEVDSPAHRILECRPSRQERAAAKAFVRRAEKMGAFASMSAQRMTHH